MKTPLTILAIVAVLLLAFQLLAPRGDLDDLKTRTDLPWRITANEDGGSRVFDLTLGDATLRDAIDKFGDLEGLAVFEASQGKRSLEGYFGTVQLGPLRARVIVGLEASDDEFTTLTSNIRSREGTPSGDWKYPLRAVTESHLQRRVTTVTYVPGTRELDAEFFRQRFGEPSAVRQEHDGAVRWFYPPLGVSILIDDDASEILEYVAPRDFKLPPDAT